MDPIPLRKGEKARKAFVGLEKAPAVTSDEPGTAFAYATRGYVLAGAVIGIAGPVQDNRCNTTNLPWQLDGDALAVALTHAGRAVGPAGLR